MSKTKHVFSVLDASGDTRHEFDLAQPADLQAATDLFDDLVADHARWAAARYADGTSTIVRAFDPTAVEHSFHVPLVGG